ncbi:MAG: putative pyruvate dehydrogenase e1 component (Alpha subunit) oxidoreductase protein [Parcubacteria group bacterium Gr01-1014_48]|nr:MAG: putative pyruvate dehydrogenase e1 component (Alpha subunit) oxidoreductase protein [Parcubacteria group bacterium Gr01-1014_48]
MKTVVRRFRIIKTQFLPASGIPYKDTPEEYLKNKDRLLCMYRHMRMIRLFDAKSFSLQRQGRAGTNASTEGEEGYAVGYAAAMTDHEKVIGAKHIHVPHYRQNAAMLWLDEDDKEAALMRILLYWGGSELGNLAAKNRPDDHPMCVPIVTQVGLAQGREFALKIRKEKRAVVCICGDGATSTGDFNTGINFAGALKVPLVVIVSNNQYAISVPRERQTAAETFAQKGIAAGIHSEQVDGNDVLAVYHVVYQALERAVKNSEPSLIEAITYRLGAHTTADDPTKYREDAEVAAAREKDPLLRMRRLIDHLGIWDEAKESAYCAWAKERIEEAVKRYENYVKGNPLTLSQLYDHQVASPHYTQIRERELLLAYQKAVAEGEKT